MPFRGKEEAKANMRNSGDRFVRAFVLETDRRLILKTPVDKGIARNNWNVSRGSIDRGTREEASKQGQDALNDGVAMVARIKGGDLIYVTNSLPYIPELEGGSSQQAPNGMVAVTAAELRPLAGEIAAKVATGGL